MNADGSGLIRLADLPDSDEYGVTWSPHVGTPIWTASASIFRPAPLTTSRWTMPMSAARRHRPVWAKIEDYPEAIV
jgi:hypothetical protein